MYATHHIWQAGEIKFQFSLRPLARFLHNDLKRFILRRPSLPPKILGIWHMVFTFSLQGRSIRWSRCSKPPSFFATIEPSRWMPPMDSNSLGLVEKWRKSTLDRGDLKYLSFKHPIVSFGCNHALQVDERILPLRRGRPFCSLLE